MALAVCLILWPLRSPGQPCGGDCAGDGAVSIGDLITAVNILFGRIPMSRCPSIDIDGDGNVAVNELVAAVGNGLHGCPATPTPSDTATASLTPTASQTLSATPTPSFSATPSATATASSSATPTLTTSPTATPTATPTIDYPEVSGEWLEDQLSLTASTCLEILATEFAGELALRPVCLHQVSSTGPLVTVVDCDRRAYIGSLDASGLIRYVLPDEVGAEGSCMVTLTTTVTVPAASSPTAATYFFEIGFGGTCPLESCTLTAVAPWVLQEDLGATAAAGVSPDRSKEEQLSAIASQLRAR